MYGSISTLCLFFSAICLFVDYLCKKVSNTFDHLDSDFLTFSHACEKKSTKKVAYPVFSLYLCTRNEIEVGFCEIPNRLSKAVFQ